MAIIAESLLIPLPNQGGVSVGFAIVLPSMIFWPCHCYVNHPIGKLINGGKQGGKYKHIFNIPPYKTAFNTSMHFISQVYLL